jgi:hypothetical protein
MGASHIIRVPRTDEEGAFVLGEITPSGSKPLNVKFVATEGEEPYVVKCKSLRSLHWAEIRLPNRQIACYSCDTHVSWRFRGLTSAPQYVTTASVN